MTGTELERLRAAMGLSQAALADELGVHVMTVSRWEREVRGVPEPVARLVERLAREKRSRSKRKR